MSQKKLTDHSTTLEKPQSLSENQRLISGRKQLPPKLLRLASHRYTGKIRPTIDKSSTKKFRKALWEKTLQVITHDGAFAFCRDETGKYYNWIPIDKLEPIPLGTQPCQRCGLGFELFWGEA